MTEAADTSRASPESASIGGAPRRERIPYVDNARLGLVGLVVIGHALRPLGTHPAVRDTYAWIFLFHMPALIFLAGWSARRARFSAANLRRSAEQLLLPYVILSIAYALVERAYGQPARLDFVHPLWTLWFLPALFMWRATLPLVRRLRAPLVWLAGAGLAIGLVHGDVRFLTVSRYLAFFPFFYAGTLVDLDRLRDAGPRWRAAAWLVLGATGGAMLLFGHPIHLNWLYHSRPYAIDDLNAWQGPLMRALYLIAATVIGTAFLLIVPRRRIVLTDLGARTLYPYLLHGFVLIVAVQAGTPRFFQEPWTWPVLVLLGAVLTLALSVPPVTTIARPLVEPISLVRKRR